MMLFAIRHILPSFENRKKVYELHTIFQETDDKLSRWSKLGLLRYFGISLTCILAQKEGPSLTAAMLAVQIGRE